MTMNARRYGLAGILCAGSLAIGCSTSQSTAGPAPEVAETTVKLDLPAPPSFEEPKPYPDGSHAVAELRRDIRRPNKKFLDQAVTVKGYVVWVYDCTMALGAKVAEDTPERCDKPNFYLADAPDANLDKAIWVVDVPRPPRPDELRVLPKETIEAWPAVPVLEVGKQVKVEGNWTTRSPSGFMNTDGLLVYTNLTPVVE